MSHSISEGAIKVIEVIGVSQKSFEDAVQQAVSKAAQSISGISGVEVVRHEAAVKNGKVVQYRAACKLAFVVK